MHWFTLGFPGSSLQYGESRANGSCIRPSWCLTAAGSLGAHFKTPSRFLISCSRSILGLVYFPTDRAIPTPVPLLDHQLWDQSRAAEVCAPDFSTRCSGSGLCGAFRRAVLNKSNPTNHSILRLPLWRNSVDRIISLWGWLYHPFSRGSKTLKRPTWIANAETARTRSRTHPNRPHSQVTSPIQWLLFHTCIAESAHRVPGIILHQSIMTNSRRLSILFYSPHNPTHYKLSYLQARH